MLPSNSFKHLLEQFREAAFQWAGHDNPKTKREEKKGPAKIMLDELIPEGRVDPPFPELLFDRPTRCRATLTLLGDSDTIIGWIGGTKKTSVDYQPAVGSLLQWLEQTWRSSSLEPRRFCDGFTQHIFREHNKTADACATCALFGCSALSKRDFTTMTNYNHIRVFFDGGLRDGLAGAGIMVQVALHGDDGDLKWFTVFTASLKIPDGHRSSSTCAELYACEEAMAAAYSLVSTGEILLSDGPTGRVQAPRFHVPFDGCIPGSHGGPTITVL